MEYPTKDTTRIARLERELVSLEAELTALHQGRDPAAAPPPPGAPPPKPPPFVPPTDGPGEPARAALGFAAAERIFRVVGIGLVVLAVGFFVSTAISRGWIGPTTQLALATSTSLAIVVQSFRFRMDRRAWRTSFAAGGGLAFFLSGAVGFEGLDLLSFPQAFAWFTAAIALLFALARLHGSEAVSLATIPAFLTGVGLLSVYDEYETLLALTAAGYVALVVVMAQWSHWRVLRMFGGGAGATLALVGLYLAVETGATESMLIGAFAVAAIAVTTAALFQAIETDDAVEGDDLRRIATVAEKRVFATFIPWLSLMVAVLVEGLGSELSVGVGIGITGLVAGLVVAVTADRLDATMAMLHQAAAIGTMAVGAVIALDGPALLVVFGMQAVLSIVLAERTRSPEMVVVGTALGAITTIGLLFYVLVGSVERPLTVGEMVAVGLVACLASLTGWYLRERANLTFGWSYGWLALLGWFATLRLAIPEGDVATSLLWAGLGVVMIVGGAWIADRPILAAGFATIAVTIAKLLVVDLASVDVLWRAGLFFAIGAGLLRLGFMIPKLAERVDSGESAVGS